MHGLADLICMTDIHLIPAHIVCTLNEVTRPVTLNSTYNWHLAVEVCI